MAVSTSESFPSAADCCEDVEIRGHIIDSLILPKVLDCILNNGGTFRIKQITDRARRRTIRATPWLEVRADEPDGAGADPRPDRRSWGRARHGAGLPAGGGRHRRGVSRGLLQHHQPAHGGPPGRTVDAGGRPGNGLRDRRRSDRRPRARCVPMNEVPHGRPDRGGARGRARVSRGALARTRRPSTSWTATCRRRSPRGWRSARSPANWPRTAPPAGRRCWWAARRSSTPAAARFLHA